MADDVSLGNLSVSLSADTSALMDGIGDVNKMLATFSRTVEDTNQLWAPFQQGMDKVREAAAAVGTTDVWKQFETDTQSVTQKLGATNEAVQNTVQHTHELGGAMETLTHVVEVLALAEVFHKISEVVQETTKAFSDNEAAVRRVSAVTNTIGGAEKFKELSEELAKVSTNSVATSMNAVAMLGKFELTDASIAKLLPKLADFSAFMGEDLTSSATKFGRAIASGDIDTRRLGIAMDDTEKNLFKAADTTERTNMLMEKLGRFHGLAADLANTATGAHQRLTNQTEELKSEIGRLLDKPAAQFFNDMNERTSALTDTLKRLTPEMREAASQTLAVGTVIAESGVGLLGAVSAFQGLKKLGVGEVFVEWGASLSKFSASLPGLTSPLGTLAESIEGVLGKARMFDIAAGGSGILTMGQKVGAITQAMTGLAAATWAATWPILAVVAALAAAAAMGLTLSGALDNAMNGKTNNGNFGEYIKDAFQHGMDITTKGWGDILGNLKNTIVTTKPPWYMAEEGAGTVLKGEEGFSTEAKKRDTSKDIDFTGITDVGLGKKGVNGAFDDLTVSALELKLENGSTAESLSMLTNVTKGQIDAAVAMLKMATDQKDEQAKYEESLKEAKIQSLMNAQAAGLSSEALRLLASRAHVSMDSLQKPAQTDQQKLDSSITDTMSQEANIRRTQVDNISESNAKLIKSSPEYMFLSLTEGLHSFGAALSASAGQAVSTMYQKQNAEQGFAQSQYDLQQQAKHATSPVERQSINHQIAVNEQQHTRAQGEQKTEKNAQIAGQLLQGNYMGAAVSLITQTKGFAKIMETVGNVIGIAMKVIEPIMDGVAKAVDMVRQAWNYVVGKLADIINKFGTDAMGDAVRGLEIPANQAAAGLDTFNKSLQTLNNQNIPSIFKTAYQTFATRAGALAPPGGAPTPTQGGVMGVISGLATTIRNHANTTNVSGPITVQTPVASIAELIKEVAKATNKSAYNATGAPGTGPTSRQFYGG